MKARLLSIIPLLMLVLPLLTSPLLSVTSVNTTYDMANTSVFERGPTVNLVTNDSVTIFWRTDTPEDSTVHYGKNSSILESKTNSTPVRNHIITLTSLDIDTKYYYKVSSGGLESEVYHFYTAPPDGEEFRMILAGDNRPDGSEHPNQPEVFSEIADLIIAEEPHIVILTGDFVYGVSDSHETNLIAWKNFNDIADRIGHYAPVIGVIGNHDTGASYGAYRPEYYFDAFMNTGENMTYFSFDYAGVHFTVLDSEEYGNEGHITGDQHDWLVEDLSNANGKMKFVFAHRPLYSVAHIGSALDLDADERDALQELFEDENVTLFASGHDHAYSRVTVNGVVHMITGGLGAPTYNSPWSAPIFHYVSTLVSAHAVNFTVVKSDSTIYTEYSIPYEGPIEIVDRIIANTSSKPIGTLPVILFSEKPSTVYYSWDGGPNSTELTGLPGPEGTHSLDVYAQDAEGEWSSARFVYRTIVPDTISTPTTPTAAPPLVDPMVIGIVTGLVGVVVVLLVVLIKRRA